MESVRMMETPVGPIALAEENGALVRVEFGIQPCCGGDTPLLREAEGQLIAYFEGRLRTFDLPVDLRGTPFQQAVWRALRDIPFGETRSYGEIARAVGNPRASRAVGMANNRNPISIIVPCHRVIGADGSLTGYGGGLDVKRFLLRLEGVGCK